MKNTLLRSAMALSAFVICLSSCADDIVFSIGQSTGGWTATNANGTWASNWKSTETDPTFITVNSGVNNMTYTDGNITCYSGTAKSCTFAISTGSEAYFVTDVSFDLSFVDGTQTVLTLTLPDGTKLTGADDGTAVHLTGMAAQSCAIGIAGSGNKGVTFKDMKVTIAPSGLEPITTYTVFDNSGSIPYRIPSICTTKDGTLVAIADYRFTKADIGGGRLDLHVRTSTDNGATWSDLITPPEMTGDGNQAVGHQKCGYGDACSVADRESGRIMVTSCSGTPGFFAGTRSHHQGWAQWYSDDNGQTWTEPRYLDEEFIYSRFDNSQFGQVRGWFVGSGKIHQSRYVKVEGASYYRLYCAGSTCSVGSNTTANWVLYSDDFGQTWEFLGGCDVSPVPGGDEPKVEELPNGDLLISSRNVSGRYYNIFQFTDMAAGQGSWGKASLSSKAVDGLIADNGCNGEVQVLPAVRKADGAHTWLALQSLPISGRTKVSIFYKDLEDEDVYASTSAFAQHWTQGLQVSSTTSAYSTWTMCLDHTLGFLYEENSGNGGYDIVYKNLSVERITNNAYAYDTDADAYTLPAQALLDQQWRGVTQEATTAYEEGSRYILGEKLLTSASQFSSPFSQNSLGSKDGGGFETLIDGKPSTYWHTYWEGGDVQEGKHYFEVEAAEGTAFTGDLQINVTRRAAANDHVREFTIYGADSHEGGFTQLAVVEMPNASSGALSEAKVSLGEGSYRVLRFVATATSTGRGYFHMAEFQLRQCQLDPSCPNAVCGDAAKAMQEALTKAQSVETPAAEDIAALRDALAAYRDAVATSVAAATAEMQPSGKYLQDGTVVICRAGQHYTTTGIRIR